MGQIKATIEKMEAQITYLKKKIDELVAQADIARARVKADYCKHLKDLKNKSIMNPLKSDEPVSGRIEKLEFFKGKILKALSNL